MLSTNAVPSLFCDCPKAKPSQLKDVTNRGDHIYRAAVYRRRDLPEISARKDASTSKARSEHCYNKLLADKENCSPSTATSRKKGRSPKDHLDSCPLKKFRYPAPLVLNSLEGGVSPMSAASQDPQLLVSAAPEGGIVSLLSSTAVEETTLNLSAVTEASPPARAVFESEGSLVSAATQKGTLPLSAGTVELTSPVPAASFPDQGWAVSGATEENSTAPLSPEGTVSSSATLTKEPAVVACKCSEEISRLKKLVEKLLKEKATWRGEFARLKTQNRRYEKKLVAIESGVQGCLGSDQLRALSNKSGRVKKWSSATVRKGLDIELLTSSTGYRVISKKFLPLPSARTVRRKIQHVKLKPGILTEVFPVISESFKDMPDEDFDCLMCFDDMSIQPALQKDPSTNTIIGYSNFPAAKPKITKKLQAEFQGNKEAMEAYRDNVMKAGLQQRATKARLVKIAGFRRKRWKRIVAYYFVGQTTYAPSMKTQILLLVRKCYSVGLRVRVITSDMGNRDLYRVIGITSSEFTIVNYFPHPCDGTIKIFCSYDVIHILKNIKHLLVNNKFIVLSNEVIEAYQLPSHVVRIEHLQKLVEFQEKLFWKPAPYLKKSDLFSNHFNKMKVAPAKHVFNPTTAAGLEYLAALPAGHPDMRTTAFFVRLVAEWSLVCAARHPSVAPGTLNRKKFDETMTLLEFSKDVFRTMKVGQKGYWKPALAGLLHCTTTVQDLVQEFVVEKGDLYLLSGRVTQDFIQNENSRIRLKHPTPTPLLFKSILRRRFFSDLEASVLSASYEGDDGFDMTLPIAEESAENESDDLLQFISNDFPRAHQDKIHVLEVEKPFFYRVCGYVVFKLLKESSITCDSCVPRLTRGPGEPPHRYASFVLMSNFKEDAQVEVTNEVFMLLVAAEECFLRSQKVLSKIQEDIHEFLWRKMEGIARIDGFPNCHGLPAKLIKRFIRMRTWMLSEKPSDIKQLTGTTSERGSKSMFSRVLVDQVR